MQDNKVIFDRDTRPSYELLLIGNSILKERVDALEAQIKAVQAERDSINSECIELRNSWDSHWGAFRHLTERLIRDEFGCTEWSSEQRRAFDELMSNSPVEPVWY
jgi:hypothetical protein